MTDEEMEQVKAEYEALPGTPPDGWSFVSGAELAEAQDVATVLRERRAKWTDMKWQRFTRVDWPEAGVWIELWKEQPYKAAPFQQLLVAD